MFSKTATFIERFFYFYKNNRYRFMHNDDEVY